MPCCSRTLLLRLNKKTRPFSPSVGPPLLRPDFCPHFIFSKDKLDPSTEVQFIPHHESHERHKFLCDAPFIAVTTQHFAFEKTFCHAIVLIWTLGMAPWSDFVGRGKICDKKGNRGKGYMVGENCAA